MGSIAALLTDRPDGMAVQIDSMLAAMSHRGRDAVKRYLLDEQGVAIGSSYLQTGSSAAVAEPSRDESGTLAGVMDGHVYNAARLKEELEALGHHFKEPHNDTEVAVHGYEQWGNELPARLDGAFALAIWSTRTRELFLARDRFGERPLLVARLPHGYAIASENRGLFALPQFAPVIDPSGLDQYLGLRRPMAPRTMLRDVQALPGGYSATLVNGSMRLQPYWTMRFESRPWSWEELLPALDRAVDAAMRKRLAWGGHSTVLLSGGLDSSAVASYLAANSKSAEALTIGFDVAPFDEAEPACAVASHFGLRHHVEVLTRDRVPALLAEYADAIDEPFTSGSLLGRYLSAQTAAHQAGLAFTGEAGDELRMSIGKLYRLAWLKQSLPKPIKSILEAGKAPRLMQTSSLPGRARRLFAIMRTQDRRLVPGLSNSFTFEPRVLLSRELRSQLPASVVTEVEPVFDEIERSIADVAYRTHAGLMRVIVQDDSVRVLDRLGAAESIEIMTPFVDSGVIDLLATVPSAMRLEGRNGDNLLRALMRGRLPDALLDRQKQAFFTPMADWLRGPLRSVLEDYARPERVAIEGIFEPQALTRLVNDHLSGRRDQHVPLRYFLMFELWRERWKIGT